MKGCFLTIEKTQEITYDNFFSLNEKILDKRAILSPLKTCFWLKSKRKKGYGKSFRYVYVDCTDRMAKHLFVCGTVSQGKTELALKEIYGF